MQGFVELRKVRLGELGVVLEASVQRGPGRGKAVGKQRRKISRGEDIAVCKRMS